MTGRFILIAAFALTALAPSARAQQPSSETQEVIAEVLQTDGVLTEDMHRRFWDAQRRIAPPGGEQFPVGVEALCVDLDRTDLGNHVIVVNSTGLSGHIVVEDYAFISGFVAIHQYARIGAHSMIQGMSGISQDVLPYALVGGWPAKLVSLNSVGLRRRNFGPKVRTAIKNSFKILKNSEFNTTQAIEKIETEIEMSDEIRYLIDFVKNSKRGFSK